MKECDFLAGQNILYIFSGGQDPHPQVTQRKCKTVIIEMSHVAGHVFCHQRELFYS